MERVAVFPLAEVLVPHQPADPAVIVSGTPTTGSVSVTGITGVEVGVWEMSSGAAAQGLHHERLRITGA
ncbi:hypothetical protein AB0C07_39530 [Actinoplanes missouriensis]|uniref:hypothetical protein n=1 Tax=Actinoplanes missouriensis TaxID=1866 RepID=UPI003406A27D